MIPWKIRNISAFPATRPGRSIRPMIPSTRLPASWPGGPDNCRGVLPSMKMLTKAESSSRSRATCCSRCGRRPDRQRHCHTADRGRSRRLQDTCCRWDIRNLANSAAAVRAAPRGRHRSSAHSAGQRRLEEVGLLAHGPGRAPLVHCSAYRHSPGTRCPATVCSPNLRKRSTRRLRNPWRSHPGSPARTAGRPTRPRLSA